MTYKELQLRVRDDKWKVKRFRSDWVIKTVNNRGIAKIVDNSDFDPAERFANALTIVQQHNHFDKLLATCEAIDASMTIAWDGKGLQNRENLNHLIQAVCDMLGVLYDIQKVKDVL